MFKVKVGMPKIQFRSFKALESGDVQIETGMCCQDRESIEVRESTRVVLGDVQKQGGDAAFS